MEPDEDSLEAPVRDEDISDLPPCEAGDEEYAAACAAGKNPWCPKKIPLGKTVAITEQRLVLRLLLLGE